MLSAWKLHQVSLTAGDHVAALFNLGRAVRGRFAGHDLAHVRKHDSMQRGLHCHADFKSLLEAVHQAAPTLSPRQTTAALVGLGDVHEDMAFLFPVLPLEYRRLVLKLLATLTKKMTKQPLVHLDTRGIANLLCALNNLGVYWEPVFRRSSAELAARLRNSPADFSLPDLRQWLFACFGVQYKLPPEDASAVRHFPQERWASESFRGLVSLASVFATLPEPDPMLLCVLRTIGSRPPEHLTKLQPGLLASLHAVSILSEYEPGFTAGRLPEALALRLRDLVDERCLSIQRVSRLEHYVRAALTAAGVRVLDGSGSGRGPAGVSVDFMCDLAGCTFCLEVNGPSHYLAVPARRPRGRTALKARLLAALGTRVVVVPYWLVHCDEDPDGSVLRQLLTEQLGKQVK